MNSTMSSTSDSTAMTGSHYLAPDWATRRIMNPLVSGLVKLGVSAKGAAILSVRGRTSGEWRTTPVNPLTLDGERYLVAPRGETQWVRNLREAGGGRLRQRRRERDFIAVEIGDSQKPRVLRAYLNEWAWEVGKFFDGVGADAPDEELAAIAPRHPVFRIVEA